MLALVVCCKANGCTGRSVSNGSLSMTMGDLEKVYQRHDPAFGGRQSADAVVVGPAGITVAAAHNPTGEAYHTWILRLDLDGAVVWERHYDPKYGNAGAMARLPEGEFVLAGELKRSAMALQGSLLHIDAAGNVIDAESLGPPGNTSFTALQVRPDGTILAGGSSKWKGWLVTTDPAFHNPGERQLDIRDIESIRLLASGDLAVLGATDRPTVGWAQTKLISVAPDGHVRWERLLPTSGVGEPAALVARGDGVVAIGNSPEGTWLVRFDNTGAVIWERMLADAGGWIAVGLADGFAVAGATTTPDGVSTQHVWRFGDDGTVRSDQQWSQRNIGKGLDQIREQMFDVDATPDGGLVLVGSTTRGPGRTNVWVVRLAPDGKLLWERIFGKAAPAAR